MNKDELIIKNIIKYINELDLITKDKDKTFFFDNTSEFNKIINTDFSFILFSLSPHII